MTKVKSGRIIQNTTTNAGDIRVVVDGDTGNQVWTVRVVFNGTFVDVPTPTPTTVSCAYMSTNPDGTKNYSGAVSFSGNAVGDTYNTTATMLSPRGGVIGSPTTVNMKVEAAQTTKK